MTSFPRSPRLVNGGIVLIDSDTSTVLRTIVLQYNPETLSRTLQVRGTGDEGDPSEALRLTGPPIETIKLEAEIDAVDQLEAPTENAAVVELGVHPQLAALETIVYPDSRAVEAARTLASAGSLEIVPVEAPLTLFVWSAQRVLPVRITEFSVTEEFFDNKLNPIRARVSLGMRVLSGEDLGFDHRGSSLFTAYHQQKERFVSRAPTGGVSALGVRGIQ
jgi:hypothetical protein